MQDNWRPLSERCIEGKGKWIAGQVELQEWCCSHLQAILATEGSLSGLWCLVHSLLAEEEIAEFHFSTNI